MTKLKLLAVDDDVNFSTFIGNVAKGVGMEVTITNDPTQFTSFYSTNIDIIVLDLFMPKIDGVELLRFLSENHSDAGIILVSGKDSELLRSVHNLALEQGLNVLASFQKPFRLKEFEQVLTNYKSKPRKWLNISKLPPSANELRQAIDNQELFLVYQPQVNITDLSITGFEALVRWKHPSKGVISPVDFIPMAEEKGLIGDITSFTTKVAIQQQAKWKQEGKNWLVSINMSPKILDDLDIPEKLEKLVIDADADITKIVVEVTETALTSNITKYMDVIARLRMKGFRLSIDDFGTGYSSLQHLIQVPFNELKVDQTFTKHLNTDKKCKLIAETSILLANKLGMVVIAEGIETEIEWNILKELGCDFGQGYWIGKPMPAEEIVTWVQDWIRIGE